MNFPIYVFLTSLVQNKRLDNFVIFAELQCKNFVPIHTPTTDPRLDFHRIAAGPLDFAVSGLVRDEPVFLLLETHNSFTFSC